MVFNGGALFGVKVLALAVLVGAVTVAGFALFHLFVLLVIMLVLLIILWQCIVSRCGAVFIGFAFGFGYFFFGVSWVYVSLYDFGVMPALLVGIVILLFCVVLVFYSVVVGWIYYVFGSHSVLVLLVVLLVLWMFIEWLCGWLFIGFLWIVFGYV